MSRFFIVLALAGCADELPSGSILDRERVLGARASVIGDPTRASPMPGEEISVRWIVEPSASEWTLGACSGTAVECTAEPFVVEHGSGEPALVMTAPDAKFVWIGGEIDGAKVMASVPIATGNHNPSLADASLAIAGVPWPDDGCIELHANGDQELAITVGATREPDDAPLQISHFTTAGALARQFSVLDNGGNTARVDWTPPETIETTRARFVIVLRDGRGGLDAISRDACIVP